MVAIGAELTIAGPSGERTVPAHEFFLGVYMTAVGPDELLTKITVPPGRSDGFASVAVGRDGTCIVNAAASANGELRVVLGCVSAVPEVVRPSAADPEAVRTAVRAVSLQPPGDVHASTDYRRALAEIVAVRAATQAAERAGG
jgi:aerobic carbon-monoxide dehydrogenase medium subunit